MKLEKLKAERIFLKPLETSDFQFYQEIYTNPDLMKYVSPVLSKQAAKKSFDIILRKQSLAKPKLIYFLIQDIESNQIGLVGIRWNQKQQAEVEIGIMVADKYQRLGFAFEAMRRLIRECLTRYQITKVIAKCNSDNKKSISIFEKLGFTQADFKKKSTQQPLFCRWVLLKDQLN